MRLMHKRVRIARNIPIFLYEQVVYKKIVHYGVIVPILVYVYNGDNDEIQIEMI